MSECIFLFSKLIMRVDVLSCRYGIEYIRERAYSHADFPLPPFKSMLVMLPFSRNFLWGAEDLPFRTGDYETIIILYCGIFHKRGDYGTGLYGTQRCDYKGRT